MTSSTRSKKPAGKVDESASRWVTFVSAGTSASGLTQLWTVLGSGGVGDVIGMVKWSGAWRQYVFHSFDAVYNAECLGDIAGFCHARTRDHRADQTEARSV